jgi:hypothetical protein
MLVGNFQKIPHLLEIVTVSLVRNSRRSQRDKNKDDSFCWNLEDN